MVGQVAKRMCFEGFDYPNVAAIFREHAALSAFENDGARDFDIGGMAALTASEFNAMAPFQWPARQGQARGDSRFFASGGYFTADRKARFHAPVRPALHDTASPQFPLRLNTGRI